MRFRRLGSWVDAETGAVLLNDLHCAKGFWQRFVGLQFAAELPAGSGVLLKDCSSVHTFWMRFSLDIAFLDEDYRVVEIREGIRPWRTVIPKASSVRHVVESNPGVSQKLRVGVVTQIK